MFNIFFIGCLILLILVLSVFFKPIGRLAIKLFNYFLNIFTEETRNNGEER